MTTRCLGAAQLGLLGSRAPLTPFSHRPFSLARRSRRSLVAVPRAEEGNVEPNVEPTEQPKRRKRRNKKKQEGFRCTWDMPSRVVSGAGGTGR